MSLAPSAMKAYIAPFGVFMALLVVAGFLPPSAKYWLYPVQTVLCGVLVIWFWSSYGFKAPKMTGFTLIVAILVLFLWISPQVVLGRPGRFDGFDPSPFRNRPFLYATVVALRFMRLVVVVPFIEEIFWRGFLLRYLIKEDFESVPPGTFTWFSFCATTIGFCAEHQVPDMPAALPAGILFNIVIYRTRSLGSCVLAHAATNLLLGIYIMRTGQWGFW